MNCLDRYILRQFVGPFVMIVTILTLVIWMTQSLQRVDILIENGSTFSVFLYLSLLVIPSLLVILIPFALFGGSLYALYRMHSDSEIAVIFSMGVSRLRIILPILIITLIGAFATLYIALDLSPRTYRILKQKVAEIRTDIASSVLRGGEFIKVIDGFTIYADEVRPGGQFFGLLINDYRLPNEPRTYVAERAQLLESDNGPALFLVNGSLQRVLKGTYDVDFITFGNFKIEINEFQKSSSFQLELTERYLPELLNPNLANEWDRRNAGKLIAEAHNRLASPFHAFAYVFISIYALIGGAYSRHGYLLRITGAISTVVMIRIGSFVAQTYAENSNAQWLQYAIPGLAILISLFLLSDVFKSQGSFEKAPSNTSKAT